MCSVTTGGNQMSEAEMDQHTIRGLREEAAQEGRPPKALVSLHPGDHLSTVLQKLFRNRCSMAPVLTGPTPGDCCDRLSCRHALGAVLL